MLLEERPSHPPRWPFPHTQKRCPEKLETRSSNTYMLVSFAVDSFAYEGNALLSDIVTGMEHTASAQFRGRR
jgi:hypothetical protein